MMTREQININENIGIDKSVGGTVLEIKNLRKSFGKQEVLKNISLKLYNGENLIVLGKSGSGKSVLIKCIVRLLNSDEGTINVFGKQVGPLKRIELDEMRTKIGFLFQSGALYDSMTVKQNIEFP
jgi:phospholipid/cholesterol/gamma-HCH transport system ATP-binding protein